MPASAALLLSPACGGPPAPDGASAAAAYRVVDRACILDSATETALADRSAALEPAAGHRLAVETVPDLHGADVSRGATILGNARGIGRAGDNDGMALPAAPRERRVRIAVGRGPEIMLTDVAAATVIERAILPAFRRGEYPAGMGAIAAEVGG